MQRARARNVCRASREGKSLTRPSSWSGSCPRAHNIALQVWALTDDTIFGNRHGTRLIPREPSSYLAPTPGHHHRCAAHTTSPSPLTEQHQSPGTHSHWFFRSPAMCHHRLLVVCGVRLISLRPRRSATVLLGAQTTAVTIMTPSDLRLLTRGPIGSNSE